MNQIHGNNSEMNFNEDNDTINETDNTNNTNTQELLHDVRGTPTQTRI